MSSLSASTRNCRNYVQNKIPRKEVEKLNQSTEMAQESEQDSIIIE